MSDWDPKYIALTDGTDMEQTGLVAVKPGINLAENVDFSRKGEVRGRPGFERHDLFGLRTYDTTFGQGSPDGGTHALVDLNYTPLALNRYRDQSGERAALTTFGRTFTYEGDRWTDRLYGGAARVDRIAELMPLPDIDGGTNTFSTPMPNFGTTGLYGVADTFMVNGPLAVCPLLASGGSVETYVPASADSAAYGVPCKVVTGGVTYHVFACNEGGTNNELRLYVRVGDALALTMYILETDCKPSLGLGDAPCACTDDSGALYIAYINTTPHISVVKVNPANGSVTVKQSVTTLGGLGYGARALWLASRTADSSLLLAYTSLSPSTVGVIMQPLEPTLAVSPPAPTTFDPASATASLGPVVVGPAASVGYWVAYLRSFNPSSADPILTDVRGCDLVLGRATISAGVVTAPIIKTYYGYMGVSVGPNLAWGIVHQPITVDGRTILGIAAGAGVTERADASTQYAATLRGATWYCIDITDLRANGTGPYDGGSENPGLLAMGPLTGSDSRTLTVPVGAVVDGLSWRFASSNYRTFNARGGADPVLGINQVTLLAPRTAAAGRGTVFSGSVPHQLAGGYMAELGYPFLGAPEIQAVFAGGGSGFPVVAGSYTVQAVWSWFDEAGQRHRSAPSLAQTIPANGTTDHVLVVIGLSCQLTEREKKPDLEIYCTRVNPPVSAPKYLVATTADYGAMTIGTVIDFGILAQPLGSEPILYTTGGVFQNIPVSADGGVASLGRRLWMSDGAVVFASKLLKDPNLGPAFNDEGQLEVRPPATAGRVVALETIDDKLIILCERGIYATEGTGPDDTGAGQDFLYPVKVSDLGVAGPRSSVLTGKGVLFHALNTATDGATGGLWFITGSLQAVAAGTRVQDLVTSAPLDLAYVPERERAVGTAGGKLVVWDMRADQWATWTCPGDAAVTVGEAVGVLWACAVYPASYDLAAGQDNDGTGLVDTTMTVTTNHVYANGQGGLGWARVRNVVVLGELATNYLTMSVLYDMAEPWVSKGFNLVATPGTTITWPSDRYAPEWRLPRQKCSQLQIQLSAAPATGAWSAIRLDTKPRKAAPAKFRQ